MSQAWGEVRTGKARGVRVRGDASQDRPRQKKAQSFLIKEKTSTLLYNQKRLRNGIAG